MEICLYCQTALKSGAQLPRAYNDSFCCQSCQTLWTLSQGEVFEFKSEKSGSGQWAYLDEKEFEDNYQLMTGRRRFKFFIEGIVCSSCVHLIEDLPALLPGVESVRLDLSESTALIEINSILKLSKVAESLEELGYKVNPVIDQKDLLDQQKNQNRKSLKELAVAGALAGNIMLFTVPIYAGLEGPMALIFQWISFFMFLPVLIFSARPFYVNAWQSLQKRMVNVDLTIVLALVFGFLLSFVNLLQGRDELYFDSTASFLFLILASRFYMRKIQQKFLRRNVLTQFFHKEIYEVGYQKIKKPAENIEVNDIVQVHAGQVVPCDGILLSDSASFDLSYLTGEAWPQIFRSQGKIFAGSKLIDQSAEIKAVENLQHSQLGQLIKRLDSLSSISEVYKTETDRAAHYLTLGVLVTAMLFFIVYSLTNPVEAFQRSLALLIVACPCAIAFGTPLALSLGIKRALQNGFFIRTESFFERMASIKTIILDKTGTLTESRLELVRTFPAELSDDLKALIMAAETNSRHPVALTLKENWAHLNKNDDNQVQVIDLQTKVGFGVEALCRLHKEDVVVSVTKPENPVQQNHLMEVVVSLNGAPKAYLFFQEKVREKSAGLIEKLYKQKMNIFILTGDLRLRALDFAKMFKIPNFRVFADQTAESKSQIVAEHNPCLYVGDGFNDLLALKKAHVSYAIEGQFDVTLSVADVYAPGKGPEGILYLMQLSHKVQSIIRGNIFFALFYNLAAGGLALMGFMNPLLAAVLMPISSTMILTHTLMRLK